MSLSQPQPAVTPNPFITIDRIFGPDADLKSQAWGPAHWLKKGTGYTSLEVAPEFDHCEKADEIKDVVHYDPATGIRTILIPAAKLIPTGKDTPLIIENFAWTDDEETILIYANAQRVWREKPAVTTGCSAPPPGNSFSSAAVRRRHR